MLHGVVRAMSFGKQNLVRLDSHTTQISSGEGSAMIKNAIQYVDGPPGNAKFMGMGDVHPGVTAPCR